MGVGAGGGDGAAYVPRNFRIDRSKAILSPFTRQSNDLTTRIRRLKRTAHTLPSTLCGVSS